MKTLPHYKKKSNNLIIPFFGTTKPLLLAWEDALFYMLKKRYRKIKIQMHFKKVTYQYPLHNYSLERSSRCDD